MGDWIVQITGNVADELLAALDEASGDAGHFRLLVAINNGFKIEIFSNEHPPPHFRVYYQGETNNFRINDCAPLHGNALQRYYRDIRKWHKRNKGHLIQVWNERRPSDCPVGKYREEVD